MSQDQMDQDRELEKYLQGKTNLSQLYTGLPEVELPDHLDAAILAEAHRAVGARPAAARKRRWAIPLGMAASLFVAVIAGLQLPYLLKDSAVSQLPKDERDVVAAMEKNLGELPAAPAPEPSAEAAAPPGKQESKADSAKTKPAPISESRAPDTATREAAAPAHQRMRLDEGTAPAGAAMLYGEKKPSVPAESPAGNHRKMRAPAAPANVAAPEPAQLEPATAEAMKDEVTGTRLSPEEWLVRIQRLKQQGRLEEARKELAAFRKSYPDYRIPEAFEVR